MQQYRVNYTLLIGLIVGSIISSGAVYGLWKFQVGRKAGALLAEADKALTSGDNRTAVKFYGLYLAIHPTDDETRTKYANAIADIAKQDDRQMDDVGNAMRVLEATVRDLPQAKDLQQRLVDLFGEVGRTQDALDHLNRMLDSDPNNAKLQAQRASYLLRSGNVNEGVEYSLKLIGYDAKTEVFDEEKASAPDDPEVYANLAVSLRGKQDKPQLADQVMDQMVKANPDSAMAYLYRGRYLIGAEEKDRGQADIDKAYELDPQDPTILLTLASLAAGDKEYDKATEFIEQGKKLHPQDTRFYETAADIAGRQGNFDDAMAQIDEGLKKVSGQKASLLLIFKADLQIHANDLAGLRKSIESMKETRFRSEFPEWYEARILLIEEKWFEATEALNRLIPRVQDIASFSSQIDVLLGLAYERLGRHDLAKASYEKSLLKNPQDERAQFGIERINSQIGSTDPRNEKTPSWQKIITDEMAKPEADRDYAKVELAMKDMAKDKKMDDTSFKLIQANLALSREDFPTARKLISDANKSANADKTPKAKAMQLAVRRAALQVTRLDPQQGPAKALAAWQKQVDDFGDLPELRLDKADMLMALKSEQLKPELAALLTGIDKWTVDQKIQLWGGMAARYLNLGMVPEAQQQLTLVVDNRPNELPARLSLFTLALDANDDAGMKAAQDKILTLVKDQNDSTWLYTEARRQLSQIRRGKLGKEALPGIRLLVERALKQRQDWHELYLVNAELELMSGNSAAALESYDNAEKRGRPYPAAVATHIRLLASYGKFDQAAKLLDRIPKTARQTLLGALYTEILFRTNQVDDAIEEARLAAEAAPNNAQNQFWYSQLLARSVQDPATKEEKRKATMTQAVEMVRKALAIEPESAEAWYALINYYAIQKDGEQAQQALREAQLAMNGDDLTPFLAKSYESLGRWFDAETMYRAGYEVDPTNLAQAHQLAEFYLGNAYTQPDRVEKATPLINQILRAGADNKLPKNDPSLLWARRVGAKMLASAGEYQQLQKAENLLSSNAQGDTLALEDKLGMAEILAGRPEPESRLRAAGLLEEVNQVQRLNEQAQLQLAELYFATGNWAKCRSQMEQTFGRFPNSAAARESYIRKLLTRGDQSSYATADTQLKKLKELAPNSQAAFELSVRLASKTGKQKEALAELKRILPKVSDIKTLSPEQTNMLGLLANLFAELGDLDTAEQINRKLAELDPKKSYALAMFLGMHRDPSLCFDKLKENYTPASSADALGVAVAVLRSRRDDVGDKFDAQLEQWIERALSENPDSISLKLIQGDFFDVKKNYEGASDIYRKLLERRDLVGIRRAIVLNNLAYLLALAGPATAASEVDPMTYINEAADILGPNSDILDTRAVILTAQGKHEAALQDLELCVTDNPTASKYFHKAVAHLRANQNRQAVESWEQAEKIGLKREDLNRLEFPLYDEIKGKIDELRKGSAAVTQTAPVRTGN